MREGEREEGRSKRREERLVAEQMETIRQQVQTETERKRRQVYTLTCTVCSGEHDVLCLHDNYGLLRIHWKPL